MLSRTKRRRSAIRRPHDPGIPAMRSPERIRKRIEEVLRLGQDGGRLTQAAPSRAAQGRLESTLAMAAYDLIRLPKLLAEPAP